MNVERAKYGLKPLIWDENVAAVARSHSIDMSLKGYFSHISPNGVGPGDRLKNAGITKIQRMGENIALCGSASRAMSLWMGSPGHRANILNPNYTHLGVGVCGYYWTQNFVAYSQNVNPASTTISLNKVGMNSFPDAIVGYGKQGAMTVTVTNKGNQATGALKISIFGTNANRFTLSATSIKNIAARGSASFSVKPKTGLAAGPYVAAVSVSGANVATQVFNVEFIVNKKLNYDIAVNRSGTHTFPAAATGYSQQKALSVSVSNKGNKATGALSVSLSGTGASKFKLSKTSLSSIGVNGSGGFTVRPNKGLAAGTYTARVNVSGKNVATRSFKVSFKVK